MITGQVSETDREIFTDAEKAFVNAFKPNYNKIKFKTYPNKEDLIKSKKYGFLTYEFTDPIILNFESGVFDSSKGDLVYIKDSAPQIINIRE